MSNINIDNVDCEGGVPIRVPSGSAVTIISSPSTPINANGDLLGVNFIKATGTVKSSAGFLNRVIVNRVTPTTIRIYDTTTIISTRNEVMRNTVGMVVVPGAGATVQLFNLPYQRKFTRGLRFLMTTNSDLSFSYR